MSEGRPTKLVRDGVKESFDEPPDEAPSQQAERIEHPEAARAGDLRRADSAQTGEPFDERKLRDAATNTFTQTAPLL